MNAIVNCKRLIRMYIATATGVQPYASARAQEFLAGASAFPVKDRYEMKAAQKIPSVSILNQKK